MPELDKAHGGERELGQEELVQGLGKELAHGLEREHEQALESKSNQELDKAGESLLQTPEPKRVGQNDIEVVFGLDRCDVLRVCEIERLSFTDPWTEISFEDIADKKTNCIFVKAILNGDIVGFGCMYTVLDEAQIMNIAVAPDVRRMGVASKLMDVIISEAKARCASVIMLEVRESNQGAIGLYSKFGFEKVGVRKNYYRNPTENAILMDKSL